MLGSITKSMVNNEISKAKSYNRKKADGRLSGSIWLWGKSACFESSTFITEKELLTFFIDNSAL